MEFVSPNTIKVPVEESIYELITLIKPEHEKDKCLFMEGPLWKTGERTYKEKLVNRTYHLPNHHLYRLQTKENGRIKSIYLRVSGRGNVNEISREEAVEVVKNRSGYVDDYDLMNFGPERDPDPAIPYLTSNCDW